MMPQNDMNVVMYKLLAYLYDCTRRGERARDSMLAHDGDMLSIPYTYWVRVMEELVAHRLVRGVTVTRDSGGYEVYYDDPTITMEGVQYLSENSMMARARDFLKEAKSALPFL